MTWNYRVMRHEGQGPDIQGECWFTIHEVYYKSDGVNDLAVSTADVGYTTEPVAPMAESVDELRVTLQRMLTALDKPVLDYR